MQLTNILRDIARTASSAASTCRPRTCGGSAAWTCAAAASAASRELIRFEAARAGEWFDRGLQLLAMLDRRSASCVLAMTGIYRRILDRIVADPAQVLRGGSRCRRWEKAWVAARSLVGAADGHRGERRRSGAWS